jgi:hypothetical protein
VDICAALMRGKGTEICDIQHSGGYLSAIYCSVNEISRSDRFLTWGSETTGIPFLDSSGVHGVSMIRQPVKPSGDAEIVVQDKILIACDLVWMKDEGNGGNATD